MSDAQKTRAQLLEDLKAWRSRIAIAEERTERSEAALRESEQRFRSIFLTSGAGVVLADAQGRFLQANPAFCRFLGCSEAELLKKTVADVTHRDDLEPTFRVFRDESPEDDAPAAAQAASPSHHLDKRYLRSDGAVVWGRVTATWAPKTTADESYCVALVLDITERKNTEARMLQLESQLSHVARIDALGEMGSILAHELSQPLAAIATYTHTCAMVLRSGGGTPQANETTLKALDNIAELTSHAGAIIKRLRGLVRKEARCRSIVQINDLISTILRLVGHEARIDGVILRKRFAADLPTLVADPIQMQQVILNLVRNALDSMKRDKGRRNELVLQTTKTAGGGIEVSVRDTGHGPLADEGQDLFEPFFTTKRKGLGMGLAISRTIVESHRGKLSAETNEDRGMTFRFSMPGGGEEHQEGNRNGG